MSINYTVCIIEVTIVWQLGAVNEKHVWLSPLGNTSVVSKVTWVTVRVNIINY